MVGYIYVAKNPLFPHLLKIGLTKNINKRIKSLSSSSLPEPYEIQIYYEVCDIKLAEEMIFSRLREHRYKPKKEFFTCDLTTAETNCSNVVLEISNKYSKIRELR